MDSSSPLQGLVAQGVEAQLLADGLQHALALLSMYVGVLLQMLLPLISLQLLDGAAGQQVHVGVAREKFRYLQLCMMGGQAERIWTSSAPDS